MIYRVTLERFKLEYKNHVVNTDLKYVNWMVGNDGLLYMYIDALGVNATYCYIHEGEIDAEIQNMLSNAGQILGLLNETLLDEDDEEDDVMPLLYDIKNKVYSK